MPLELPGHGPPRSLREGVDCTGDSVCPEAGAAACPVPLDCGAPPPPGAHRRPLGGPRPSRARSPGCTVSVGLQSRRQCLSRGERNTENLGAVGSRSPREGGVRDRARQPLGPVTDPGRTRLHPRVPEPRRGAGGGRAFGLGRREGCSRPPQRRRQHMAPGPGAHRAGSAGPGGAASAEAREPLGAGGPGPRVERKGTEGRGGREGRATRGHTPAPSPGACCLPKGATRAGVSAGGGEGGREPGREGRRAGEERLQFPRPGGGSGGRGGGGPRGSQSAPAAGGGGRGRRIKDGLRQLRGAAAAPRFPGWSPRAGPALMETRSRRSAEAEAAAGTQRGGGRGGTRTPAAEGEGGGVAAPAA